MEMRKTTAILSAFVLAAMAMACGNNASNAPVEETSQAADTVAVSAVSCDKTLGGIHFTKMLNGADTMATEKDGVISFRSVSGQDFFCDPNGVDVNLKAPILLTEIDNTKPFTLTARIRPGFSEKGTYNAGVLYLYENDAHWQKFCFEQDERGNHRVVTVRTIGTSDDNNSEVITGQDYVYYRYASDTKRIGSYFSRDGKTWTMVRLYKNDFPGTFYVGISSQCPSDDPESICEFSELSLKTEGIENFRFGE